MNSKVVTRNEEGAHRMIATIVAELCSQYIRGEAPFAW